MNVNLSYTFVVGEGSEPTSSSSELYKLDFKNGDGCDDGREYFVGSNRAWVRMSVNTSPLEFHDCIVVSLAFTQKAGPGICNEGTRELCIEPPGCMPYAAICDGRVDCQDFSDQVNCKYCGFTDVSLNTGVPVILHFPSNLDDPAQIGLTTDCIWNVTAPQNSIIEINMVATAKDGPDIYVKPTAGGADDASLIVLRSNTYDVMYSNASAIKIYADAIVAIYFKIQLTAYTEKVCHATDFQCHNQQCVSETSVCDGIQDCAVLEDEYGCDNCSTTDSYMCPGDQSCINSNLVCDGTGHCTGFTDEFDCGRCGDPYIELSSEPARIVQPVSVTVDCVWIVSTSSRKLSRIRLDILQLMMTRIHRTSSPISKVYLASLTIGTGSVPYVGGSVVRRLTRTKAYPPVLTFDGPAIWIIVDVDNNPSRPTRGVPSIELSIMQQAPHNCNESQYACSSGLLCIQKDRLCNGQVDCPEFDDEIGCEPCDGNQFKCTRSNGCLDPALLCDGEAQCPDSSDEGKCAPCGENYIDVSSSHQSLTSPFYPNRYHNNIHCEWFVHGARGFDVVVVIIDFYTERDFDYLLVEYNSSMFVKLSGKSHLRRLSLYTQEVKLSFLSDYTVAVSGFSLRLVQMETASCGDLEVPCNGTTHLQCILETLVCNAEGDCPGATDEVHCPDFCGETKIHLGVDPHNITSPRFPNLYPLETECIWEINAVDTDVAIKLEIHEFHLERGYDWLEIRDTNRSEHQSSTVFLSGTTRISAILYRSRFLTMRFTSDEIIAKGGFLITLKTVDNDYTLFKTCPNLYKCPATANPVDFCLEKDAHCDGFGDCPDSKDEISCGTVDCDENEYRCDGRQQCLMWGSVCNGIPECELFQDDETDCATRGCPGHCTCFIGDKGLHVKCNNGWTHDTVDKLVVITGVLDLIGGNITTLDEGIFKRLVNLKTLSLRNNNISRIELNTFAGLSNLTSLDISENHFTKLPGGIFEQQVKLTELGLRSVPIHLIETNAFKGLKCLEKLVLMHGNGSIDDTHEFATEVEAGALTDLLALQTVYVDDYKLCCDFNAFLNNSKDCVTTQLQSPLFNCGRLMPNAVLQGFMWLLGFSALIGNAVVIAWRIREDSGKGSKYVHSFLVLNLAISDFFMGVYMIIIATVDEIKKESYYLVATQWRNSALCKAAGIISVLSSEASVFFITLISIDRYMCIVHPFSRVRLRERSVWFTAGFIWIMTLGLSVVPTVLITKDSNIYGLSDVCIGLPLLTTPSGYTFKEQDIGDQLTNDTYLIPVPQGSKPSWSYSIVLFLGVNLSCFITVTYCYIAIFAKVKRSIRRVKQGSHKEEEIKMASKMAIIVGSDFLCWMPVIVLGILSQTSVIKIEPDVYAWLVVFVLPINSSLNPYLYTIVTVISRRRQSFPASSRKSSKAKHGATDVDLGGKNDLFTLTTKTGTLSTSMDL
ncbi:uncharacterized protein LOC117299572 [Asterias rubens]|uniref:uncharacterized protein LOC117299572 n=1 Tax=Asterias rubens TaxID=7604 RepID=UPI0014553170|nr:uncharacterized protein LOC117299572 [Asterias rubens]